MRCFHASLLLCSVLAACDGTGASTDGAADGTRTSSGSGGASSGTGGRGAHGGSGATGTGGKGGTNSATGGTAGGAAGLLFVGDFETGDLSQWHYVERCQTDRIVVYSIADAPAGAPAPRGGQYAALFHVLDTDVAPCTSTENPRAELETAETLFKPGDDRWEAWSVYIPEPHPAPNCGASCPSSDFFAFQDNYGAPYDGSPSIGWFYDFTTSPNNFSMNRGAQYNFDQPWISPLIVGGWVDFLVHIKFSNANDGTGSVEGWVNGNPITFSTCNCTTLTTQTMHSTQTQVGFYLQAYRSAGLFDTFDVYYDEIRVGTTRAAVELTSQ